MKWVLYQTIVDLGSKDRFVFRCGNYAYSKIKNIFKSTDEEYEDMVKLDLNGEIIIMILCTRLDKKQIIISNKSEAEYCDFYHETVDNYTSEIKENDIVLYFA